MKACGEENGIKEVEELQTNHRSSGGGGSDGF